MSKKGRHRPLTERLARKAAGGVSSRLADLADRRSRLVSSQGAASTSTRGGAMRARVGPADETAPDLADREDRELERRVLGAGGRRLGDVLLDVGQLLWRYRRELTPIAAAVLVIAVAAGGRYLISPALWFTPLLLGGLLTMAWRWRARRAREHLYGAAVGTAASVLAAAGWSFGVLHEWFLVGLVALTAALGLPWWRHQLPRSRVARVAAVPKSMRQQLQQVVAAWPTIAEARGIGGVRLQQATPDEYGFELKVRIPTASRLTVADLVKAVGGLEASLKTRVGAVRVEPDRARADRAVIRVNLTDPLARPIDYPGPSAGTIAKPVRLGIHEDRSDLIVQATGGHWLLGGATGSGKSVSQRVLLAELLQREDVVCWGADVAKAGVQFVPWVAALARLATEPAEALSMLQAAIAAQRARARWMAAEGLTEWPLSREHPQLVIVIDEVSDLLTIAGVGELLEQLVKLGREQGITVIAATQRASADALGDSAVARAQFGVRIALKCRERGDGDLILGAGKAAEGWRPDRLQLPGELLVLSDDHQVPRPGRAYLLSTKEARAIAERAVPQLATLDMVTAAAVEAVAQSPAAGGPAPATRGPKLPARDRVLKLLTDAGEDGMTAADLVAALDGEVSRPSVYRALGPMTADQLVTKDDLGVYRFAPAGREADQQTDQQQ